MTCKRLRLSKVVQMQSYFSQKMGRKKKKMKVCVCMCVYVCELMWGPAGETSRLSRLKTDIRKLLTLTPRHTHTHIHTHWVAVAGMEWMKSDYWHFSTMVNVIKKSHRILRPSRKKKKKFKLRWLTKWDTRRRQQSYIHSSFIHFSSLFYPFLYIKCVNRKGLVSELIELLLYFILDTEGKSCQ